jgi:hypothetical protein
VWSGSDTGVHEQPQAFSTFSGLGAGDLVDAVLTPAGAALVGSWQSADAGLDIAVWTAEGDTWSRNDSTSILWVPESLRTSVDLPVRHRPRPSMIHRWR